jgi:hypothetical protein
MNGAFPLELTHIEAREHPEWHGMTVLPHVVAGAAEVVVIAEDNPSDAGASAAGSAP